MKNPRKAKHADIWIDATWISVFKTDQKAPAKFPITIKVSSLVAKYTAQGYAVRVL